MYKFSISFLEITLICWFHSLYNSPKRSNLSLTPNALSVYELRSEAEWIQEKCLALRADLGDTNALKSVNFPLSTNEIVHQKLREILEINNYNIAGNVKGQELYPKGILLHFSTSGIYLPFVGQAHIDGGLHPIQKPFTMAHELGHGYGFAQEDACNFLGFLACIHSDNKAIQYAGYLAYWRYVYSELKRLSPDYYRKKRAEISIGMANDLEAIYANNDAYPDLFPNVNRIIYDNYLKAQGVSTGVKSYNRMVILVTAWRKTRHKNMLTYYNKSNPQ